MKKTLALLLALVMALALVACGGNSNNNTTPPADNNTQNEEPANNENTEPAEPDKVVADPNYPASGTLNVVVGWGAGGTTDLIARKVANDISVAGGFNNNVTNVTGSSGSIAADQVQQDGKTSGETLWGGMISAINTWKCLDYADMDWTNWYAFISCQTDFCLAVAKDSQFNTYEEFVEYGKANPGKLRSGNPGIGSVGHLAAVTFAKAFDFEMTAVPYQGGRAAALGVMGGEIEFVFIAYGDIKDLVESGDLKALAFTGADREITTTAGTTYSAPGLDAVKPEIAATTSKLGMWGVAIPRTVPAEQVLAFQEKWLAAVTADEYIKYCEETLGTKPVAIYGVDADKTMAEGQSVYVAILEGEGLTAKSAADLGIPSPADYSWDKVNLSNVTPWPNA